MNSRINILLKKIGLFNTLKLFKDKYFENPFHTEYRKRLIGFYSQFIRKGDLCFDIGASYGNRTETFLALGAEVVTLEPQKNEFNFLRRKFGKRINLINKAVGARNEFSRMFVSDNSAISSLSEEWIKKVSGTGRFRESGWDKLIDVDVITLDSLIEEFGIPDFCKIDVEGYEFEVLKGLSKPIRYLSFEFTIPEFGDRAIDCLNHLGKIGRILCNYSSAESLKLGLNQWIDKENFISLFLSLPSKNIIDGDIYVRYPDI